MEAEKMVGIITEALYVFDEDEEGEDMSKKIINSISSYKDEGVLTDDKGIVIKINDHQKSVFHITVQKQ